MKGMNICSSLMLNMMIHFSYGLHCLMPSTSALGGFRTRISAFPPYLYCVYSLADLPGHPGYIQDFMAPARVQTKIIPTTPGVLAVSARKLCLLAEKYFVLAENGQCRRIHRRKANNRLANCCSLGNRHANHAL